MGRPGLHVHAPVLRRGPRTLQVGFGAAGGVILSELSAAEIALVERLDGTLEENDLRAGAARAGCRPERIDGLFTVLRHHALLVDRVDPADARPGSSAGPRGAALAAQTRARVAAYGLSDDGSSLLAARASRRIVIGGEGAFVTALRDALVAGGFGRVGGGLHAEEAADLELRSTGTPIPPDPGGEAHDRIAGPPDLVVLVRPGAMPPGAGEAWRRRRVPVLPVVTEPTRVVVGPIVVPGGPCLRCLDLHRVDADPAWPTVLEQVLLPGSPAPEHLDCALLPLAAGAAAALVTRFLDTGDGADGTAFDAVIPGPDLVPRRWPSHPRCACAPSGATMAR